MFKKADIFNPEEIVSQINFSGFNKHPNILIAAHFWEDDRYHAAKICYQFMRRIDDMIDDRKADDPSLSDCEKQMYADQIKDWIECLNGKSINDPFFQDVLQAVISYRIPLSLFDGFAKSMIYDVNHNGFHTFDDFLNYAEGASVVPASVFVHLCCLNEDLTEYVIPSMNLKEIARPCALFAYLVHMIRDFQLDQDNHQNYFSIDILEKYNLTYNDLKNIANGSIIPSDFRKMICEYKSYAASYKQQTEEAIRKLSSHLDERYLLSLHLIYQLYLQIYNRIDPDNGQFTAEELNPTPQEIEHVVRETISKQNVL
jgi:phytoene synthase